MATGSRTPRASPRPAPYRVSDFPERFRGSHSFSARALSVTRFRLQQRSAARGERRFPCPAAGSEADDGADGRLNEGCRHGPREFMNRFPAGAVGRKDATDVRRGKGLDGGLDDRLEDPAGQMTAADEAGEPAFAGE